MEVCRIWEMNAGGVLFSNLALWEDTIPRNGPVQMACDEVLLREANIPVLRIFRWKEAWVTSGYFIPWETACGRRPDLPVCRRWTGGGIVVHEGDFTFSLVAPKSEAWASLRPQESYKQLHEIIANTLQQVLSQNIKMGGNAPAGLDCFAQPVQHDLLYNDKKIVGGAQRRTREGLLYQGSIQGIALPSNFLHRMAAALAHKTSPFLVSAHFETKVTSLAHEKYERKDWLHRPSPNGD